MSENTDDAKREKRAYTSMTHEEWRMRVEIEERHGNMAGEFIVGVEKTDAELAKEKLRRMLEGDDDDGK